MAKDAKGHGSDKRAAWMGKYEDALVAAHPETRGKVDWNAATFHFNSGKSPEDAAAATTLSSGGPKSEPAPVHDSMAVQGGVPNGGQYTGRVDGQYYGRALNKAGRKIGEVGPHPDHETAAKAAFATHPNARSVSTSRGSYGMDLRFHRK